MVVRQHLGAGLVTRGVRRRKDGGSRRARATPQLERWRYTRSDGLKRFNRDSSARTGPGLWLAVCRDFRVVLPAIQTQGRASTKARPICLAATSTRAYASSLPACTSGDIILNDKIVPENKVTTALSNLQPNLHNSAPLQFYQEKKCLTWILSSESPRSRPKPAPQARPSSSGLACEVHWQSRKLR